MGTPRRLPQPPRFRRPARGRADLLYYRARQGKEALARSAELFGYQAPEPEPPTEQQAEGSGIQLPPGTSDLPAPPPRVGIKGMRFIRLRERQSVPAEQRSTELPDRLRRAEAFTEPDRGDPDYLPPPMPPLAPWRRLWPFLRAALGTQRFSHRLDLPRLVDGLARGRSFRRLPRLPRAGWGPAAQLILDLDLRLYPFWEDFYRLVGQLHGLRGKAGLEIVCFEDGPDGACRPWRSEAQEKPCSYRLPEAGTPLLVLSDLGLLDGRAEPWLAFGRRLKAAGLRPVALMPCPKRYWDPQVTEFYLPVVWDHARRLPRRLGGPRPRPDSGLRATPDPAQEPGVARLLRLLAFAVRVEPALLRAVRHRLPAGEADVGSEAAVWRHPDVRDDGVTFVLRSQRQEAYRDASVGEEDPELRVQAVEIMRRQHQGLSPAIRHEEEMIRAHSEGEAPDPESLHFLWNATATLFRKPPDYGYLAHLKAWVLRMAARQHHAAWTWEHAEPLAAALVRVRAEHDGDDADIPIPPGFDVNRVLWAVPHADQPQEYHLVQEHRALKLKAPGDTADAGGNFETATALVAKLTMITTRLQWQLQIEGEGAGPVHLMDIRREREIPVPEAGHLRIQGNFETLVIDGLERPDWALIQQRGGRLELNPREDPARTLCWFPPDDYAVKGRDGRVIGRYGIPQGFFLDQEEFEGLTTEGFRQPDWAEAIGLDEHGLWADFRRREVTQRFRWIAPGEFWMGSPEDEPERSDDETQHPVMLTQSFWLAETAVTQALWQAVMGDNPSRFKGAQRPADNVSWEQASAFIERLNGELPDLGLRLPSEAEWEYACRAGTTTPFWFGDTLSTEQANYHGEYPYAGGARGEYREKTVEVKALPANAWGLHQMHGNVWEWCQDWYGDYPKGPVRDPRGPNTGANRVLRGGCWIDSGWNARSARRNHFTPVSRSDYTGFRLARGRTGQSASQAGKE